MLRLAETEGPQRIGTRKPFVVVPESTCWPHAPRRKPLGQWLLENMPRGIDLEMPDRTRRERYPSWTTKRMSGYLLDTNVVSETMRSAPNSRVAAFLVKNDGLWLSSMVIHELEYGVRCLPQGNRRAMLRRDCNGSSPSTRTASCRWTRPAQGGPRSSGHRSDVPAVPGPRRCPRRRYGRAHDLALATRNIARLRTPRRRSRKPLGLAHRPTTDSPFQYSGAVSLPGSSGENTGWEPSLDPLRSNGLVWYLVGSGNGGNMGQHLAGAGS